MKDIPAASDRCGDIHRVTDIPRDELRIKWDKVPLLSGPHQGTHRVAATQQLAHKVLA